MMEWLKLVQPLPQDAAELLEMELRNRVFFEQWIYPRPSSFYQIDAVVRSIEQAQLERKKDLSHQYLIKSFGSIVGRINLFNVVRANHNKAVLGYRIAEEFCGKSYATHAVNLMLSEAFAGLDFWRIEASTRSDHKASMRVLMKNQFKEYGRSLQSTQYRDRWYDTLHFECHSQHWQPFLQSVDNKV
jgi:ribosomal-protein-alanine N-acetyltransferase